MLLLDPVTYTAAKQEHFLGWWDWSVHRGSGSSVGQDIGKHNIIFLYTLLSLGTEYTLSSPSEKLFAIVYCY